MELLINQSSFLERIEKKKLISKNLDYKITIAVKRINKEASGILPFGIRIKWKNTNEISSYVQSDNIIVILKKGIIQTKI
jgi:hypothetical protein